MTWSIRIKGMSGYFIGDANGNWQTFVKPGDQAVRTFPTREEASEYHAKLDKPVRRDTEVCEYAEGRE